MPYTPGYEVPQIEGKLAYLSKKIAIQQQLCNQTYIDSEIAMQDARLSGRGWTDETLKIYVINRLCQEDLEKLQNEYLQTIDERRKYSY